MDKTHFLMTAAGQTIFVLVTPAHVQSASSVFAGPRNMDAGLQNGLNNLTGYVHFLPFDAKTLKANDLEILAMEKGSSAARRLPERLNAADSEACR